MQKSRFESKIIFLIILYSTTMILTIGKYYLLQIIL